MILLNDTLRKALENERNRLRFDGVKSGEYGECKNKWYRKCLIFVHMIFYINDLKIQKNQYN